jgi:hypothetical protein
MPENVPNFPLKDRVISKPVTPFTLHSYSVIPGLDILRNNLYKRIKPQIL